MATCIIYKHLRVVKASNERRARIPGDALPTAGRTAKSENGVEFRNIGRAAQKARPPRHYHNHRRCVPRSAAQAVSLCERALRELSIVLCHSAINLQGTVRRVIFLSKYLPTWIHFDKQKQQAVWINDQLNNRILLLDAQTNDRWYWAVCENKITITKCATYISKQ